MDERVLFLMYFSDGEHAGERKEVMDVDKYMWDELKETLSTKYQGKGILDFMFKDFPIHLTRDEFLSQEGPMRKVHDKDLSENAYKALFSLDVFVRQLDELVESDIMFDVG